MKGIKAFCGDVRIGFSDFGIKFLPRLLLFPLMFLLSCVLTAVMKRHT